MKSLETLQSSAILTMLDNISEESHAEVVNEVLKKMTLDQVLHHPVVLAGYKHELRRRCEECDCDSCKLRIRLLPKINDAEFLRKAFQAPDIDDDVFCPYFMSRECTRCYRANGQLILISDYYDIQTGGFDFGNHDVVKFDCEKDIFDADISMEDVYVLTRDHHIRNTNWTPINGYVEPQTLAVEQRIIKWWQN